MKKLLAVLLILGLSDSILPRTCLGDDEQASIAGQIERWQGLLRDNKADEVFAALDIAKGSADKQLAREATFFSAKLNIAFGRSRSSGLAKDFERISAEYPNDDRYPILRMKWADRLLDGDERIAELRAIAVGFPDSRAGRYATGLIRRAEGTGKPVNFEFTDIVTKRRRTLNEFRGKWIVLDFWATWCGPCVALTPSLLEMQKELNGALVVIAVSLDEGDDAEEKVLAYTKKTKTGWPQCIAGRNGKVNICEYWGITLLPRLMLIDPEGNLVCVDRSVDDLKRRIDTRDSGDLQSRTSEAGEPSDEPKSR